jgi:hypothetical protein
MDSGFLPFAASGIVPSTIVVAPFEEGAGVSKG